MALLENKVAIVTGAGRGLGRAEAIELSKQGATVVVQDLGVALDGSNPSDDPANEVVSEIEAQGGKAHAHFGDVSDYSYAERLVGETVERFGDLHVLVNNAGILRDRMIFNMEEAEWDAVVRVHLKGHFNTTRHAVTHWRNKAKAGEEYYGSIVNTTSEAALFGSAGQPNYAASKAGIIALTTSTANAMVKYGIRANAIAPRARTTMTETSMPEMFAAPAEEGAFDVFAPENVSPLVAFLASPAAAKVTGQVFIIWGNEVKLLQGPRVEQSFITDGRWTAEGLAKEMGEAYEKRDLGAGYVVPPS